MSPLVTRRRRAPGALVGALVIAGACAAPLAAQDGCEFGEDGNDVYRSQEIPGGGTITYVTRPHFVCDDGVQIWADSAVAYSNDALSHLIGRVRFLDSTRELRADEARYFSNVGRLQATGRVAVENAGDSSRVENGDLVYLRQTDFRAEESMTFTTGADGLRPRATIPPPESAPTPEDTTATDPLAGDTAVIATSPTDSLGARADTTEAARERSPYLVVGDRITFLGSSYFSSTGRVEIERDSLFAFADSAEYTGESESLVLVGSARVLSADYTLVGRTISMRTDAEGTNEVRAVQDALLTGEDLTLTAPIIKLYLVDGAVDRLVAVPLRAAPRPDSVDVTPAPATGARSGSASADGVALGVAPDADAGDASAQPRDAPAATALVGADTSVDSASVVRPLAVSEGFELTADSLDLTTIEGVVEQIFSAGRARSVSYGRGVLNVAALPELARQDWLEGDTIVIDLVPVAAAADSTKADGEAEREYEIETIVARVGARSLYRLPAQDSTVQAGIDPPALHYVVGDEITIHMLEGEVEAMEVVGQTRGVHLEPLGRPVTTPAAPTSDTTGVARPEPGSDR